MPVSSHLDLDALARRGAAVDAQPAAIGHRLARIEREIEQRLPQHPGIRIDARQIRLAFDLHRDIESLRLRRHGGGNVGDELHEAHRLQLELVGTREFQKPDHHFIEPPDLLADGVQMLFNIDGRRGALAGRTPRHRSRTGTCTGTGTDSGTTGCRINSLRFTSSR